MPDRGLRLVTPCTPRIDRLVDLLEQILDRDERATRAPEWTSRDLQWLGLEARVDQRRTLPRHDLSRDAGEQAQVSRPLPARPATCVRDTASSESR